LFFDPTLQKLAVYCTKLALDLTALCNKFVPAANEAT
jgi:hypothetical protein